MLDIGWSELLLIGIVALIVVGPKDLPALFRTVGQYTGRARSMAREFQRSLEQAADESGVKDASRTIRDVTRPGNRILETAFDPSPDTSSADGRRLKPDPAAPAGPAASDTRTAKPASTVSPEATKAPGEPGAGTGGTQT